MWKQKMKRIRCIFIFFFFFTHLLCLLVIDLYIFIDMSVSLFISWLYQQIDVISFLQLSLPVYISSSVTFFHFACQYNKSFTLNNKKMHLWYVFTFLQTSTSLPDFLKCFLSTCFTFLFSCLPSPSSTFSLPCYLPTSEFDTSICLIRRQWDTCREVPIIEDEHTPWKLIKLLKLISLCVVALFVFGFALCSKVCTHIYSICMFIVLMCTRTHFSCKY